MRAPLLLPALLVPTLLTGCASDTDMGFSLRAVLDARTDGVRLLDDGATGHAAMIDQLCTFDASVGDVTGDLDLGVGQEELLDASGDVALARLNDTLYRVRSDGQVLDSVVLDARDARLVGEQSVALVAHDDGCAVAWLHDGQATAWAVPGTDCHDQVAFDVDRSTGTAWIADGEHLARLTPAGEFARFDDVGADLLAWDPSTGGVVLGAQRAGWVQAVDPAGEPLWTRRFEGGLTDVDTAGAASMVALMIREDDAGGALEIVGSETGELTHRYRLPHTADLAFSSQGHSLGLVTSDRVFLYDVETDVSLVDTPSSRGASRVDPWGGIGVSAGGSTATAAVGTAIAVLLILD